MTDARRKALPRLLALAAATAPLAACTVVGPDYQRPEMAVPQAFRGQATAAETASVADLPWWAVFDDPALQTLISDGLANNQDLKLAVARIERARAMVGLVQSQGKPQLGYGVGAGIQNTFVPDPNGAADTVEVGSLNAGLNLAWEFDVWGRIQRASEAAQANLLAEQEVRRGVMLSLAGDIATGYFRLLELDRELVIARESSGVHGQTRDLFNVRFEAGRDSLLPVQRAQAIYDSSEAKVADIERRIAQQENALALLTGGYPRAIPRGRALDAQVTPVAPVGATSDLLLRRPDILAAEQRMVEANAQVGAAIAERYPRIGLSALAGVLQANVDGNWDTFGAWGAAVNLMGPLYDGGRLDSLEAERRAHFDETVAQYRKTVLTAFQETSDALVAQQTLAVRRAALERQVAALRRSSDLAMTRYRTGRAAYFEVLEAQQQLFPTEDALAQTRRDQLVAVVNLYKALGGGWQLKEDWTRPGGAPAGAGQ